MQPEVVVPSTMKDDEHVICPAPVDRCVTDRVFRPMISRPSLIATGTSGRG